jgi:prefoldin subunit 5
MKSAEALTAFLEPDRLEKLEELTGSLEWRMKELERKYMQLRKELGQLREEVRAQAPRH